MSEEDDEKNTGEEGEGEAATPTPRLFSPGAPTRKLAVVPVVDAPPLARPVTPRWERTGPVTRPPRRDSTVPRTEHIVVVEDYDDLRIELMQILTEVGYSVRGAVNGIDALEKIFGDSVLPDLVLLDIGLPKMSGVAVKAAIEAEMGTRGMQAMPICVITAGDIYRLPSTMHYGGRVLEKNKAMGDIDALLATIHADISKWRAYLQQGS